MAASDYHDRTNAPIDCPLKKSAIAWQRCHEYRQAHKCLCKEARERLRIKGEGKEVFEQKLREIRQPIPSAPVGWRWEKLTRFYMIYNAQGELVHRAANQAECEDYIRLVAMVETLREENHQLWRLLEGELTPAFDPWEKVNQMLAEMPAATPEPVAVTDDEDF